MRKLTTDAGPRIVNLPGFAGEIVCTPEALAGNYPGKDPKMERSRTTRGKPRASSSGPKHRRGTPVGRERHELCRDRLPYLTRTSPEWKRRIGVSIRGGRQAGRRAGTTEVAKLVKEIGGSIGYVAFMYALRNHLKLWKSAQPERRVFRSQPRKH
jgi:ABC-type phosphate transport system substrate-binding protein